MTIVPPNAQNKALTPSQSVANYKNQQLGGILSTNPGQSQVNPTVASPATPIDPTTQDSALNAGYAQATQNAQDALSQQQQNSQNNQLQIDNLSAERQAQVAAQQQSAQNTQLYGQQAPGSNSTAPTWTPGSNKGVEGVYDPAPGGGYSEAEWGGDKSLSSSRNEALSTAFSYVGDPYVLGGTSHQGIDCSGLVMAVYDQLGYGQYINNHSSRAQGSEIPGVRTAVSNLQPGDIVAWADGSHIAIYAGNGMIVAAAAPGEGVKYQPVWGDVYGIHLTLPGE